MFVYLKQGLVLKKKDSLPLEPNQQAQGPYLMCQKQDHQENALNIICYDPFCSKRGLLCSACFFQEHNSHHSNCANLKDFLKKYREYAQKEKETSQKQVNEADADALKVGFEGISRIMLAFKQRFDSQYAELESSIKQKELFLTNSLQNKNTNDIIDLLTNISQGSINTINGFNDAMTYLLDGLSGNMTSNFRDEKLKQDLMPNHLIVEKVQGLRIGLEAEFQCLDANFSKTAKNCRDLLLDKGLIRKNEQNLLLKNDLEGFLSEIINKNIRISSFVRLFKGSDDGFLKKGVEKRLEGKQGLLALVKSNEKVGFGIYYEGGLKYEIDKKYVIFSINERKKLKEGRNWGGCSCFDKDKMLLTSSNLHELVIYEEGEESYCETDGKKITFEVKDVEIYELLH